VGTAPARIPTNSAATTNNPAESAKSNLRQCAELAALV
jgi:hypothetical protein